MLESLQDQPETLHINTSAAESDEDLSPQELERRTAERLIQVVNELKKRLSDNNKEIYAAQQRFAENECTEEEVIELQAKGYALRETLLSTMGQYADMMQQRIMLAGIIPMWADVEPGRLINVAA
ncbi:MAG: hypothetical protein OIF57_08885 [Marinobacterium sp.]|nr:hypothetical protein [Marinobacterium sp.]